MLDINQEIERLDWHKEPVGLYEPIAYTLASGGKRLRPQLVLMAGALYGGADKDLLPAALGLEIFHNFTLLHDDVMDAAPVRRGRPTVHVQWDNNTAILSGDQMIIEAYKQLEAVPADKYAHVMHLFSKMGTEICEGQQMDMDFELRETVSQAEYLEMIRLKTSVLLGAALEIGAYIGGAPQADQAALQEFGTELGLAFQIQDDMLDVWGDPATFGKQIGGDILQNKKSMAMLVALTDANEEQQRLLYGWLHRETFVPSEKIQAVRTLYEQIGVREKLEQMVTMHTTRALEVLGKLSVDAQQLAALTTKLNTRKS